MNYANSEFEDRMRMAREYFLLTGHEIKIPNTAITEACHMFHLYRDEAVDAYFECREMYAEEWKTIKRKKFFKQLFGIFFCLIIGAFFLFIGQEKYFFIQWSMGIVFILLAFGILLTMLIIYRQEEKLKKTYA